MLVKLLPGADRNNLRGTLRDLGSKASNLRSPLPMWQTRDWLAAYIEWTTVAAGMLRGQIATTDIERLVWAGRYGLLASKVGLLYPDLENAGLNHVLSAELADRAAQFEAAYQALNERIGLWSRPGAFVAFDTNVYIHHEARFEDVDIAELVGATPGKPVHLLVPMAVLDELDNHKRRREGPVRGRASVTTAVLYRLLRAHPTEPTPLVTGDDSRTVELLPDPPGHVRLPRTDDEIVERLVGVQALAGRPITLVTYDTGQALRAKIAGLAHVRLRSPDENQADD